MSEAKGDLISIGTLLEGRPGGVVVVVTEVWMSLFHSLGCC